MQNKIVDLLAKRCKENGEKMHTLSCSDKYCKEHRHECYGSMARYLVDNGVTCTEIPKGG